MPKIGSSPMNLTVVMSPTDTAASPESTASTQYAIVFYHDRYDPPEGWIEVDAFDPDPTATYEVIVGDLGPWNRRSDKYAIYEIT
jgi:hypothetical protein